MADDVRTLEVRTIDGECYIRASDVVAALRRHAKLCSEYASDCGEESEDPAWEVAWRLASTQFSERADELDFAAIVHYDDDTDSTEGDHRA